MLGVVIRTMPSCTLCQSKTQRFLVPRNDNLRASNWLKSLFSLTNKSEEIADRVARALIEQRRPGPEQEHIKDQEGREQP